jgi:hypothetical protein
MSVNPCQPLRQVDAQLAISRPDQLPRGGLRDLGDRGAPAVGAASPDAVRTHGAPIGFLNPSSQRPSRYDLGDSADIDTAAECRYRLSFWLNLAATSFPGFPGDCREPVASHDDHEVDILRPNRLSATTPIGDDLLEPRPDALLPGGGLPPSETPGRRRSIQVVACAALVATAAYLAWRVGFPLGSELWIVTPLWLLELYALLSLGLFAVSFWASTGGP